MTNNNSNENGGGVFIRGDGTIVTMIDNTIDSNTGVHCGGAAISGGGPAGQVTLINNIISNNVATNTNGGIALSGDNEVNVLNNSIVGNESEDHFGGIAITGSEKIILSNNIISNNSTNGMCGGFYCDFPGSYENGVITATNNTIVQNTAITNGGGVCIYLDQDGQSAQIYNNIILNNNASERNDIYILNDVDNNFIASPISLFNNNFDQSTNGVYIQIPFSIDPNNLNNEDPLFVDYASGDYHLTKGSPCKDAGGNNAPELPLTDIDGESRIIDGVVDMGADEYLVPL
jgi:hypothetical protein